MEAAVITRRTPAAWEALRIMAKMRADGPTKSMPNF